MLGGGIGAVIRYAVVLLSQNIFSGNFPWATLIINLSGSFLVGFLFQMFESTTGLSTNLKIFLLTGFLGGFTTFSAFSLENMLLFKQGQVTTALFYILLSNILAITLVFLGVRFFQFLFP